MKRSFRSLLMAFVIACTARSLPAGVVIGASEDISKPSQQTGYGLVPFNGDDGFQIIEAVGHNPNFGPWRKLLTNTRAMPIASGNNVPIQETLTNIGNSPWSDWHERVISRTTISQPDDSPGFLFRADSLVVSADYGSGFITLVQGVDYARVVTPYSGPSDPGNNGNWEAINILLAPNRVIANGQRLRIEKQIFEIFGDGDVWRPGPDNAAVLGQFPTVPEPGATLIGVTISALLVRRRAKR